MAQSVQKITLSASRDIPFNKLLLSACNVRRVKAGVSIEQLADDIARRTLLQSLTVRPVLDAAGIETGMYEIPAGGRRFRALELLVKQKRLAKTAPIPCVIREGGIAEEDSLAENVQRAPLHPLDQFRAFLALREKGQSEEEIAAAFFVSVAVVKQRLRLASVSPKLLDVYAEDGLTLDQLMAFTVNGDHERQEQVFDRLSQSYTKEAYVIRRMLTEGAVRAADKRALFVGIDAYEEAGGTVMRDLFQGDDGGWLQDPALLDQLVVEKLQREAETVAAEGWKWIEVAPDFAYGHHFGLRQLRGDTVPLTAEEEATRDALRAGIRPARGGVRLRRGGARGDRPAHDRDRDHARHAGRSAGGVRSRGNRARRRVRQHRRRGRLEGRAGLHPAGGRAAGRGGPRDRRGRPATPPMSRSTRRLMPRRAATSFTACRSLPQSRRRKTASSRCRTGC